MTPRRFSISRAMVLIGLLAVDLAGLRELCLVEPGQVGWLLTFAGFGVANILAVGWLLGSDRRKIGLSLFFFGCLVATLIAVALGYGSLLVGDSTTRASQGG